MPACRCLDRCLENLPCMMNQSNGTAVGRESRERIGRTPHGILHKPAVDAVPAITRRTIAMALIPEAAED
jgi:hypothetical protein